MVTTENKTTTGRPPRKTSGKKISPYNHFVKQELARLKDTHPDMPHQERYEMVVFAYTILD
ncbi:hypothetical protein EDC04DRAFT_2621155 [Pisolithus marmoratus]|nr:hypothetical protein EDC04DRAFT_2621155 [Pisolithus marmoratus]